MPFLKKSSPKNLTRIFFATDLHASERAFRKFINAGKFYQVKVLIMGGDVLGKLAVPIIREGNDKYRATIGGQLHRVETAEELQRLQEKLGLLGFYFKIMEEEEFRALANDRAAVEKLFHDLARERLQNWIELAETRLKGTGIQCFVTGGNDDYADVLEVLYTSGASSIVGCEGKVAQIDDTHTMISQGFSTPTPWNTPREVSDNDLGVMIEKMIAQVPNLAQCIFNFHDPPVDSTLDTCPLLDWKTDPPSQIVKGGQVVLHGAGSRSVRHAIEKYQPLLGLHGHIHESAGAIRIGRTLCINPGSEYGEGILRGVIVNLGPDRVESYQMTSG
jgi:Icc-related predicted phosphoesterase